MKFNKNIFTVVLFFVALFAIVAAKPLALAGSAAYNPLTEADENLTNLEKARLIMSHFQKSGVDSSWAYDIETNKDVVEVMLLACVEMTDEEVSQLTDEEQLNFYAYFQKLYEVSGLDATELGEIFELKDLEKAVDEIYHVEDKKTGEDNLEDKKSVGIMAEEFDTSYPNGKSAVLVILMIAAAAALSIALSRSIEKNNHK